VGGVLPTLPHSEPATAGGVLPTLPHSGRRATRSCSLKRLALPTLPHVDPGRRPLGRLSPATENLGRRPICHRLLVLPMRRVHAAPAHLRRVLPQRNIDEAQLVAAQVLPRWWPPSLRYSSSPNSLSLYRRRPRYTTRRRRRWPWRTWGRGGTWP
jgi:hypothetical protein